jgi:hypothetical protein
VQIPDLFENSSKKMLRCSVLAERIAGQSERAIAQALLVIQTQFSNFREPV